MKDAISVICECCIMALNTGAHTRTHTHAGGSWKCGKSGNTKESWAQARGHGSPCPSGRLNLNKCPKSAFWAGKQPDRHETAMRDKWKWERIYYQCHIPPPHHPSGPTRYQRRLQLCPKYQNTLDKSLPDVRCQAPDDKSYMQQFPPFLIKR